MINCFFRVFVMPFFISFSFLSCGSSQDESENGIPKKYIEYAKEFCKCNGAMLSYQMKLEKARADNDFDKLQELISRREFDMPKVDMVVCNEVLVQKMTKFENEDGNEIARNYFLEASKVHCPVISELSQ